MFDYLKSFIQRNLLNERVTVHVDRGAPNTPINYQRDYYLRHIFNQPHTAEEILRVLPKGVSLYRIRAKRGQLWDRGVLEFKSMGRTGAKNREILRKLYNEHNQTIRIKGR